MTTNNRAVLDVLVQARELIAAPEQWTQGETARDAYGNDCGENDDAACCWCAMGAIWKSADQIFGEADIVKMYAHTGEVLARYLPARIPRHPPSVAEYNDDPNTTHADVIALFDRAITSVRYELSDRH